ncbi:MULTISPECIES: class I SAM-dependent methyltransferase [Halobacteriales]|jgi:ubiquinone/menaquinone biosynthesis C-methylase UbiE|uniref:Class I SAM-dependent methyltransferase n=1 Tax=Halopenitus salinus TaxID=1198295 RepID=A0ABD5UQ95_9EURY|nr:methyltransferase domain-containing protein [Natrialba aegyptia]
MPNPSEHKRTVRRAFTKQAAAYAENASVTDPEWIARLVEATGVDSSDRVLEVATGPGHVAFSFGDHCAEVVGLDLTKAPLEIAQEKKRDSETENVAFIRGDAEAIPCPANSFDVVVCRLALHHVEHPDYVVQEMARVCRPNGTLAVGDLVVSEHSDRAEYHNTFERLRDPSHVRALSISELIHVFTEQRIEIDHLRTDSVVQNVESWLSNAQTPEPRATEAREMIRKDAEEDLSGTQPFWHDDELYFRQLNGIVAGHLLE